jgi:hypothetical protein
MCFLRRRLVSHHRMMFMTRAASRAESDHCDRSNYEFPHFC